MDVAIPIKNTTILNSVWTIDSFTSKQKFTIFENFTEVAVKNINQSTKKVSENLPYFYNLTPLEAQKELNNLKVVIDYAIKTESKIKKLKQESEEYVIAALSFISVLKEVKNALITISGSNETYIASKNVLAKDWLSKADEHWDEY